MPTIAVPDVPIVNADMPDNLACALTTLMVEHKDQLVQVHPAAEEIDPELMGQTGPIPLHPGSERALEELG